MLSMTVEDSGCRNTSIFSAILSLIISSSVHVSQISWIMQENNDNICVRLGPPGDHTSLHLQPALTLQLDKFTPDRQVAMYTNGGNNGNYRSVDGNRVAMYGNKCNGDSCRFDSGFRDSGQLEQEPHLEKAINAVRFVAQHVKNQDRYNKVGHILIQTFTDSCWSRS